MHPLLQLPVCAALFMVAHISLMAWCAGRLGIIVREIVYGAGPTLYAHGMVTLKLLPFFGSVLLKDTRTEVMRKEEVFDAYNYQPLWKQVVLPLSGPLLLLLVALPMLGMQGWHSFIAAFFQIIDGALHPLSRAQEYLKDWDAYTRAQPLSMCFALLTTKLSAFNLLPFGGSNGFQALTSLARRGKPEARWEDPLTRWLLLPGLAVFTAWLVAFAVYVWKVA